MRSDELTRLVAWRREACASGPADRRKMAEGRPRLGGKHKELADPRAKASAATEVGRRSVGSPVGRNLRDVWTVGGEPFPDAHFAVMPTRLVVPCVRAGTSARGVCPACGAPWRRVEERVGGPPNNRFRDGLAGDCKTAHQEGTVAGAALSRLYRKHRYPTLQTVGWSPGCRCGAGEPVPATVLDPFCGAGTVGVVCAREHRRFVGIELSPAYAALARARVGAAYAGLSWRAARAGQGALFAADAESR